MLSPVSMGVVFGGSIVMGLMECGINKHEVIDLRSGTKCFLRNFVFNLTVTAITAIACVLFALVLTSVKSIILPVIIVTAALIFGAEVLVDVGRVYDKALRQMIDQLL